MGPVVSWEPTVVIAARSRCRGARRPCRRPCPPSSAPGCSPCPCPPAAPGCGTGPSQAGPGPRGPGGQAAADDQVDAAAGAHLVEQYIGLQFEFADHVAVFVEDLAFIGADLDHVAHVQVVHRGLEHQGAGIFHGVVEDRCHLAADADAAAFLVRHAGMSSPKNHSTELVADLREEPVPTTSPTKATGRPFALISSICFIGPTCTVLLGCQAVASHLVHGQRVQRDVRADQASGAGDRSSVLVSPVTLKTRP
jgi:hypothetical protein